MSTTTAFSDQAFTQQNLLEADGTDRRREFEDMLPRFMPRFRRMALRSLRNLEDAEDVVQDAMLSAFRHIARFDGRSQMSTWLTAILNNAVRMHIRRSPRGQMLSIDHKPEESLNISEMLADPRPTQDKHFERREMSKLVAELVDSLPQNQQTVLRLRVRDELSIEDTAELLGVPEGTVKARLARGRAHLAERFVRATARRRRTTSSRRKECTTNMPGAALAPRPFEDCVNA